MAWTQNDLDALTEALGQGALRVRFEGKEVIYRSLAEMRSLRAEMTAELAAAAGVKRTRTVRLTSRRGW